MFLQIRVHRYTSVAPTRRHAPPRLRACVSDSLRPPPHASEQNIGVAWPAAGIAAYPRSAAIAAPSIIRWPLARPNGSAALDGQPPAAARPPPLCPADSGAVTGA